MSSTDDDIYPNGYLATHDWDWDSGYCKRCGAGRSVIINKHISCVADDGKVSGISHRISKRRRERLHKRLTDGLG